MPKLHKKPLHKAHTRQDHPAPTIHSLSQEIETLTREFRTSNSFRQKFISAIITGFGTVIGATVLVALLIFVLTQLASIELLRPFVESIVNMVKTSYK